MATSTDETVAGRVVTPGDPEYDRLRASFNATVDRRPLEIHICAELAHVLAAVRRAGELGAPIAVRGGGHSVAGHGVGEGAVVVDLRGMRRVSVDAQRRRAVAEGGATWEDYDAATTPHGLASTGGTFVDTGIGGLTLGGGIGYLMGTQGLTVDTLTGIRMVTAAGEVIHASEEENAELFWGIRGAGANFGVVFEFEYRLQPVTELYGGSISYSLEASADVIHAARELARQAPDELHLQCIVGRRSPVTTVLACFQGPSEEGELLLRPLRQVAGVQADELRPLTYAQMQATNPLLPFGLRHYWKGHFLRALPDGLVALSAAHAQGRPTSGFATVLIEFINGAPLRVANDAMAFNQRQATVNASALAIWADPVADSEHAAWARAYAAAVSAEATGVEYVNYMSENTPVDRLRAIYGPEKFARLQGLKARFDPGNAFRFNQNIPPG